MSKIGKKPIQIPDGVEVKIEKDTVKAKGPKGELERKLHPGVEAKLSDDSKSLIVSLKTINLDTNKLWGLERSLVANIITGVSSGFEKKLEINGVGYRAAMKGKQISLELGYSHSIELDIPEGLEVKIEKNIVVISGIDKQKVGQFAAEIRNLRPPEPYKGKGVKYIDEHILRKEGKKAAAGEGE